MQSFNRFLTTLMAAFFGVWVGNAGMVLWQYINTPERFAAQSAPWYTQILVQGLVTIAVLAICWVIKLIIKKLNK